MVFITFEPTQEQNEYIECIASANNMIKPEAVKKIISDMLDTQPDVKETINKIVELKKLNIPSQIKEEVNNG